MNKHFYALKTIAFLLVFGLISMGNNAFAQSVIWTGNVDSDWANPANWSPNEVPTTDYTATITANPQGGNFPTYAGDPTIDYTIQNFGGTITFNSFVYNEGMIANANGTMITNNFFVNAGEVFYSNDGRFDNNGIFENFGQFRNTNAAVFNNAVDAAVNNYGSFTNFGPINNDGFWGNFGSTFSSGSFNNFGTIDNRGTFDNGFGSSFQNEQNGVINNTKGQFLVNGVMTNNGQASINNNAELIFLTASDINNQSALINQGEVSNSSKVFSNNGSIINDSNWTNEDASNLENNNSFENSGAVEHSTCAKWIQNATATVSGVFINEGGLVYEIGGNVDVTGGEFGYEFNNINDKAPPVPGCRAGVIVQLDENGHGSLTVDQIDKGAYGNCGAQITNRTITPNTFTTADIGSVIVTLFVEDEFGLSSTCDATVQVLEYVAPIVAVDDPNIDLTCPTSIVLQTEPGADFVVANWTEPTGTTNCNTGGGSIEPTCPGLVQNPGFEDGLTGYQNWRNTYIRTDLSDVHSGSKSAKVGSYNGGFGQTIEIEGGVEYTFSAYAEKTSDQTEWAGIGINYYDANWNHITGKSTRITAHSFELYAVTLAAPSNATKAVIFAWKNGDRGRIYVDDLCFIGNTAPNNCASENIAGFVYMGEFNGSRYYCSSTNQATFQEAQAGAEAAGGHLVTINSQAENDYVQSKIGYHSAWIGFTNLNSNNLYWTSGSSNFINWKSGEPNELHNNVGARILKDTGLWTDRTTGNRYEYVMEIECGNEGTDGPQVCDLLDFGQADNFNEERLVWIDFDNTNSPFEYNVRTGAKFQEFANGTATLIGKVDQLGNSNAGWEFSVKLINKRNWSEWSALGRSFKQSASAVGDHTTWNYYEVDNNNSAFTGIGSNAGKTLTITHMPSDYEFGFQVGNGANDKDGDYGLSGWYNISGDMTGRGDFNADLGGCVPTDGGNGDGNLVIEQIAGPTNGSEFLQGTTQVAYRATDDCGNEEICVFDVTVERTPSEITITGCPENIVVDAAPGAGSAVVDFSTPTGVSNCFRGSAVEVTRVDENANSGSEFPIGQTYIGYVLTDDCGAVATCNFVITVNYVEPVLTLLTCPGDFTATSNPVAWAAPTASSTCFTGLLKIEQVEGPTNGSDFPVGVTRVSYLVADECDNTAVCFFDVTVEDAGCTTPDITINGVPEDITVECNELPGEASVNTEGGCGTVTLTVSEELVGDECYARLIRTWTATDSEGNIATDSQEITVTDTQSPTLDGVPADMNHPKGQPLPAPPTVTAFDNCSGEVPVLYTETQNGDQITRKWEAEDNCGNPVDDIQIITLIDDTTPCPVAGTECDDNDPNTENDVEDGNCNCAGTPIVTCPVAGTECDDNDPNTENDVEDGNCNCEGTPIAPSCDLGFNVANVTCDDNGTQTEPNDDQFTFNLTVYNLAGGTTYTVDGTTYRYGEENTFGPFPIANGTATIVVYDSNNTNCSDRVTVDAPAPCTTLCDITASASNIICNDNGTASDPNDDTFTFDLTVTGEGNPWAFMVGDVVYTYDDVHAFGPFAISDGDVNITVVDKDNPTCTDNITVSAPATCSDQPVDNCNKEVLFIVGNTSLNSGDLAAKQRLDNLGLNVTLVDDDVCQTSDADGKGLIVVSSTVSSGRVKDKYRDLAIPFVTWEVYLYDDMKMTGTGTNTNYGKYDSDNELNIVNTAHPIASGLNGKTVVFNSSKRLSWGKPGSGATTIATIPGRDDLAALFAYEAGDKLVNGSDAPARRVGLWLVNSTAINLDGNGGLLFDSSITYALGCASIQTLSAAPMSTANAPQERRGEVVEMPTEDMTSINIPSAKTIDNELVKEVSVFPNPATTFVNVDLTAFENEVVEIRIFDQTARLVQQVQIDAAYGNYRVDFNDLQNGMYLIQVRSGEEVQTKKLIVKRY